MPGSCQAGLMATRSCPQCGSQYVASVRRCITCDVVLVDDAVVVADEQNDESVVSGGAVELGDGDQIAYALDGWGNQLKVSLEGMMDRAGIRRVWEAGTLVVQAADEEAVDDLIATIEGSEVGELLEQVAFEIEGLDAAGAEELDAQLMVQGIAHAWSDDGDLLVAPDDEEAVSAIIDVLFSDSSDSLPDDGAPEESDGGDDGLAANEALSDLYLVLDRLLGATSDKKLAARLGEVADVVARLGVPYGFSDADWSALSTDLSDLITMLRDGPPEASDDSSHGEAAADGTADTEDDDDPGTEVDPASEGDEDGPDEGEEIDPVLGAVRELRDRVRDWI